MPPFTLNRNFSGIISCNGTKYKGWRWQETNPVGEEESNWRGKAINDTPEPPQVDWILEGYIAHGRITELAGIM